MKIVITGVSGYIAYELCKLYSGETRKHEIIGIDNRFCAQRVKQLKKWGIKFVKGDILDAELMKELCHDAYLVYHLAGVTDVAYLNTDMDIERDGNIHCTGVVGTKNIIDSTKGKIIFPSTHVVFEGVQGTEYEITEQCDPIPKLTYSRSKVSSELDLAFGHENFVVLRLASVYGLSDSDTMRINIMPNLFASIAAHNGTIKLHSGGVQHKSLVSVRDVARCMKFMGEGEHSGVYHVSNESVTIKEVAEMCKRINPGVNIVSTNDEIPNLGYTLSNKKLLDTGFVFKDDLYSCLREMIEAWSDKPTGQLEDISTELSSYTDDRGTIANYQLPESINWLATISSKAGTVRANHYHPIQEQKCILISGKYISVTKDLLNPNAVLETRLVQAGDLSVIQPNVAHTMVFLEDSVFLNLVNGEREHANFGEHTVPYTLVDDSLRDTLLKHYKCECRVCGNTRLKDVLSLGMSPLANNLVDKGEAAKQYPLELKYCQSCHNLQSSIVVPATEMFDNYLYTSSTSSTFRKHFEDAAKKYKELYNLNENSLVVDIGSNDGVFLRPLLRLGIGCIGVEPSQLNDVESHEGLFSYKGYFDKDAVDSILSVHGHADLVTASNVFAHADDLKGIIDNVFRLLKPDGTFIIEVQSTKAMLDILAFDNIYHEHVNYWNIISLWEFCRHNGYVLVDAEQITTHGGSLRCYIKKEGMPSEMLKHLDWVECMKYKLNDYSTYEIFGKQVNSLKQTVLGRLPTFKKLYPRIAAYGSPAKATTALNYFGIDTSIIEYTIEDNELKHGKYIPGVNIPIVSKQHAIDNAPDLVIVLAWNFYDEIVKNNQDLGCHFISIKDLNKEFIHLKTEPTTA